MVPSRGQKRRKQIEKIEEEIDELYQRKVEEIEKKEKKEREKFWEERKEKIDKEMEKEGMELEMTPELEKEAEDQAEKFEGLEKKRKIKQLLSLAENKGIPFAVQVARKTGDPYLLDIFHDLTIRYQLHEKLKKK